MSLQNLPVGVDLDGRVVGSPQVVLQGRYGDLSKPKQRVPFQAGQTFRIIDAVGLVVGDGPLFEGFCIRVLVKLRKVGLVCAGSKDTALDELARQFRRGKLCQSDRGSHQRFLWHLLRKRESR